MNIIDSIINSQIYGGVVGVVPSNVITDNYEVKLGDYLVLCNFATEKTITLPTNAENNVFIIKCIGNGNIKILSEIDGVVDLKLYKGGVIQVICKENKFYITASAGYGL